MKRHSLTQRQQTRRFLTGTLFALSVLATGGPAAALDGKTLPGSACEPLNQSAPYAEDIFGGIFNPSTTQTLTVNCPVVRDTIGGNSSNGIDVAVVKVFDQNLLTSRDVSCNLTSRSSTGQVVEVNFRSTTGASSSVQTLTFTDLASQSGGFYNLSCSIPPKNGTAQSGIIMYEVDETN